MTSISKIPVPWSERDRRRVPRGGVFPDHPADLEVAISDRSGGQGRHRCPHLRMQQHLARGSSALESPVCLGGVLQGVVLAYADIQLTSRNPFE